MKNQDALVLLLLLYAVGRSSSRSSPWWMPTPAPATDERWLVPGVYWWCASASEAEPLIGWFRDNSGKVQLAKMLGSNGGDCAVVLFEVKERIRWPLSGTPEEAPRGLDTTLDDLRSESKLEEFFRKMAASTWEQIKAYDARIQQWLDSVLRPPATSP
jgi:hypothetical protein